MGNILLKKTITMKKLLKSKSNARIVKDKDRKLHCSKCGAFICK